MDSQCRSEGFCRFKRILQQSFKKQTAARLYKCSLLPYSVNSTYTKCIARIVPNTFFVSNNSGGFNKFFWKHTLHGFPYKREPGRLPKRMGAKNMRISKDL
ncbi:hypothetical protein CDAR_466461 [Caerostris darwini]|uniref:Uncharacterized protein n=1 Tax=Caerostris darwini TaxID=1538125 RepID=A0AAV4WT03_9ARAC|nr:hypothetical protein CDAR_466461 [Caerostris darwini]